MPVSSALTYLQRLLNGLAMPGPGTPALVCNVKPPEPFSDPATIPTCYVWMADGQESRGQRNATGKSIGTFPRNTGPGTPAGLKGIVHQTQVLFLWSGTDEAAALLFPRMIDTILAAIRTAYPMPATVTEPDTGEVSRILDAGEAMTYRTSIRPQPDQQGNQYEAVFGVPLTEEIRA